MLTTRSRALSWVAPALLLGLSLAACASAPTELRQARVEYRAAARGDAKTYAPVELREAHTTLQAAEHAFDEHGDTAATRRRAQLAIREARAAASTGARRALDRAALVDDLKGDEPRELTAIAYGAPAVPATAPTRGAVQAEASLVYASAIALLAGAASVDERGGDTIIAFNAAFFDAGRAALSDRARADLARLIPTLQAAPSRSARVEGYTNARGPKADDLELSTRRAEAVRLWLMQHGAPETMAIQAVGMGASAPVASGDTPHGRARNRRVVVVLSGPRPDAAGVEAPPAPRGRQ